MSKRVLMVGLAVSVGLATLQGGTAEAQWQFALPPGMWWYYGSVDGCAIIGSVPNPDKRPARLYCEVEVTKVESLCQNPANKDVAPGEAATQVIFSAANGIDQGDLFSKSQKDKGKAQLCVQITSADADCLVDPDNPLCNREYCVNPNWYIVKVLTSQFVADCRTDECTGTYNSTTGECTEWTERDTQSCECTLPAPYSIENPPEHCTDPFGVGCTAYECFELNADGVRTGNLCQLQ